jgi:hypothetical protein
MDLKATCALLADRPNSNFAPVTARQVQLAVSIKGYPVPEEKAGRSQL